VIQITKMSSWRTDWQAGRQAPVRLLLFQSELLARRTARGAERFLSISTDSVQKGASDCR